MKKATDQLERQVTVRKELILLRLVLLDRSNSDLFLSVVQRGMVVDRLRLVLAV